METNESERVQAYRDFVEGARALAAQEETDGMREVARRQMRGEAAPNMDEPTMRRHINNILANGKDAWGSVSLLSEQGNKTYPVIIEVMKNGPLMEEVAKRNPDGVGNVIGLFNTDAPPEIVPYILPIMSSSQNLYAKAIRLIALIGSDQCIMPVLSAMQDDQTYIAGEAALGVQWSIHSKHSTPAFRQAIFQHLAQQYAKQGQSLTENSTAAMLRLDPEQAMHIFWEGLCTRPDPNKIQKILKAANEARVCLPADKLFALMEIVQKKPDQFPVFLKAEILIALARTKDQRIASYINEAIKHADSKMTNGLAKAIEVLGGIEDPFLLFRRDDVKEYSIPQSIFWSIRHFVDETNNGGIIQYFDNCGDEAQEACRALLEIGAKASADILKQAINLFGPSGPAKSQAKRQRQMSRFSSSVDGILDSLEKKFYSDPDKLEILLAQYVVRNKSHFVIEHG